MSLQIVTADQRLAAMTVKMQIWGGAGVGKTTLLKTLDPATTLAIAPERGLLSVQKEDEFGPAFMGDSIEPDAWPEHMALLQGFQNGAPGLAKYRNVFIDSTSIISKHGFEWAKAQPESFTKTGALDTRGAYGLLRREMSAWAWGWKNTNVNVYMIGGLEMKENEATKFRDWMPLIMGGIGAELPYIFDYSLVMARFPGPDNKIFTGIFTNPITNPEYASVPVKTRGGCFDSIERPHLGYLTAKALGRLPAPSASTAPTEPANGTPQLSNQQSEAA